MGQKSPTETVIRIFTAFLENDTWRQPDLARKADVTVEALKKRLDQLTTAGIHIERSEDSPTEVFWSVPVGWFPGGVFLADKEERLLLYAIAKHPPGPTRDKILAAIAQSRALDEATVERIGAIVLPPSSPGEDTMHLLFEAASERKVVQAHYHSGDGRYRPRTLSVHRVLPGPRPRALAWCHTRQALRWFRIDGLVNPGFDESAAFVDADPEAIQEVLDGTLGGFYQAGEARTLGFRVRPEDASWVRRNLLDGMEAEDLADGGLRVRTTTAAVESVARFVVGLGARAAPETPELAAEVARLAREALEAAEDALDPDDAPPT